MDKKEKVTYIGLCLIFAGLIWFSINLVSYVRLNRLVQSDTAVKTTAEIFDYEEDHSRTDQTKTCKTYYEFYVDDKRYAGVNSDCYYRIVIGTNITIYYNEEDPSESYSDDAVSIFHLWPIIMVPIGAGVFIYAKKTLFL